jgi:hypothetical protein
MSAFGTKLTSGYGHRSAQGEDRGLRIQLGQLGDIRSNPPRLIAREPKQ